MSKKEGEESHLYPKLPNPSAPPEEAEAPVSTTVIVLTNLGTEPVTIPCPHCGETAETKLSYKTGCLAWLFVGALAFLQCWICICLPCCVKSVRDVVHKCGKCKKVIGVYRRLGKSGSSA